MKAIVIRMQVHLMRAYSLTHQRSKCLTLEMERVLDMLIEGLVRTRPDFEILFGLL